MNMHIPRTPVFVTSLDTTNTRTDTHALGSVPGKRRRSAARSERSCTAARGLTAEAAKQKPASTSHSVCGGAAAAGRQTASSGRLQGRRDAAERPRTKTEL